MSIPLTIFIPETARNWTGKSLQAAIQEAGFQLKLHPFNPKTQVGMIPCKYKGIRSGFEYFRDPITEYMVGVDEMREDEPEDYPYSAEDLRRITKQDHVVQLITHSSFRARIAAVIVGACLAEMTNGWVLDEPVWKWYFGDKALKWARDTEEEIQADVESHDA